MGWGLRSKEEIQNVLQAAQTAVLATVQRLPASPELEAYLDGYATALVVVAQGLGVEIEVQPLQKPPSRSWDTEGHLLPASLLAESWTLSETDESDVD